jgi:transposase-like protein
MTNLTDPIFTNEEAARAHFEALRWPDGRMCPHCGTFGNSTLMQGKTTRPGLYKYKDCRKPFTATMGTVYERSHIPLHKWLLATHLLVSSKKHERPSTFPDARLRLLSHRMVHGPPHP